MIPEGVVGHCEEEKRKGGGKNKVRTWRPTAEIRFLLQKAEAVWNETEEEEEQSDLHFALYSLSNSFE